MITINTIQRCVVSAFDMRQIDMTSARRSRRVARPRQVAMYLARELTRHSLPEIGRSFGKRDHTTVMHAISRISALILTDPDLRAKVEMLRFELSSRTVELQTVGEAEYASWAAARIEAIAELEYASWTL